VLNLEYFRCKVKNNYTENFRPQFHFSPQTGWMNDPNGLVYYDGEYHLFYQHIPAAVKLHNLIHWGHAISSDLIHWQHLPIALYPDHNGEIWSGSAVVDWNNTSGFQTGHEKVLVAIFTQVREAIQQQSIAYSNDRGRNWIMYQCNPVIENPGRQDFRDPKVFWHKKSNLWVMVLAAGDRIIIYNSTNLKEWISASEFGEHDGSHEGKWECPDLFELAIDGDLYNHKWVLLVSVLEGSPNGGSGMQYFIGDFDGKKFTNSYSASKIYWVDYGRDSYAGVTFSDIPLGDERRISLSWMSNWSYASDVPTSPWRGSLTIPRQLILKKSRSEQLQLVSLPCVEIKALRKKSINVTNPLITDTTKYSMIDNLNIGASEIIVEYQWNNKVSEFGFILMNEHNNQTIVGYNAANERVFVDRRCSGVVEFNNNFKSNLQTAEMPSESNILLFHVFVDWSSIEIFVNGGFVVMTNLVFPPSVYNKIRFFAKGGEVQVRRLSIWEMNKVWK
jgi:fructan beta-fructosidase